ncbi:zinc finger MYM-type protein 1-like [Hydra vulgaris]|uniref:zinc finger MYM-type protein 1-like n=1 Tax=Hydra vulgaris TaxID=6087 RepID=UPI0032EA3EB4
MAERKKPSGAQYRKRKVEQQREQEKQKGSLLKFICRQDSTKEDSNGGQIPTDMEAEEISNVVDNDNVMMSETLSYSTVPVSHAFNGQLNNSLEEHVQQASEEKTDNVIPQNPALWPLLINHNTRAIIVERGPQQIKDISFPNDKNNRKFSVFHYLRKLPNGEELCRSWLLYSVLKDSVFCFCCKLFSMKAIGISSLTHTGSSDWKNMAAILSSHEKSPEHLQNYQKWKELHQRLQRDSTIDAEILRKMKNEEKYWQQILKRLIALVRVLGEQNLAFRGTNETLYSANNGNFLKFVQYLAIFDPLMNKHLRKISNKELHTHYLGKDIQNELIQLLGNAIKKEIIQTANAMKYFSIVLDGTPDCSHVEQMTIIIRFVKVDSLKKEFSIKEHFLGFVPLKKTTGAYMEETIIQQLEEMELPIDNLRGQGYDNGANMIGKNNGVQKKILNINPRALFVPCSAHTLNLVVNDAANCCLMATSFFDIVQRVYVYFLSSTHRLVVFTSHQPTLTVKPLSETRWESRIEAIKPLRYELGKIYDALLEIADDTSLTGSSGSTARSDAKALANSVAKFKFVVSIVVWSDIGFARMLVDAAEIAKDLEIPPTFEAEPRLRRRKKQFAYEAEDEPVQDPKQNFKVNFFFAILDTAIRSVEERFEQMRTIESVFGFLYHIHGLQSKTSQEILECCMKLESALQHGDNRDLVASDLCGKLQSFARRLSEETKSPQDVFRFILCQNLEDSLPNLCIALCILLTLPVSVASGERSFSKLKLIKTYIRSSMCQDRLVGLATLSIEHELADKLDLKDLVIDFAQKKARKVQF